MPNMFYENKVIPTGLEEMLMRALGISPAARMAQAVQSGDAVGGDGWYDMFSRTPAPSMAPNPAEAEDARLRELAQIETSRTVTPYPVPDEVQTKDRVFAAIADAMSAYARGMNPAVPTTNALEELRQRRAMREATMAENTRMQTEAEGATARECARLQREEILGRRAKAEKQAETASEREFRERMAREGDEREAARSKEAQDAAARNARELAELRGEIDIKTERVRQQGRSDVDKVAERQKAQATSESKKELKRTVVNMKAMLPKLLEGGMQPDEIRQQFLDALDIEDLPEEDRAEMKQFFRDKIEPLLAAPEQQVPASQAPITGPAREGLSNVMGAVRSGAGDTYSRWRR